MIYADYILEVKDLSLDFKSEGDKILNNISFNIRKGEILGLIGNSGCGKSMTALSILGLLPKDARILSGQVVFDKNDLLEKTDRQMREVRGKDIGMIFQEPYTALDPLKTVYKNLEEVLTEHEDLTREVRREMIGKMLERVGFENTGDIMKRYPHELSGGQRQRVLIAGACLLKPKLMIADEPTSSLDTVTSMSILELIKSLCAELRMSVLFISHDLSIVGNFCDRVLVMKKGNIVDSGNAFDLLYNPQNPYTAELLSNSRLDPKQLDLEFNKPSFSSECALKVTDLCAGYTSGNGFRKERKEIIHNLSFKILKGEVVGLIGSSGCGKTTLTRAICGLIRPYSGTVTDTKGKLGVVFQDPIMCLNPAHTVMWHLAEPLRANKIKMSKDELKKAAVDALVSVGLDENILGRHPSQLSGGQRQRVAIAMCLMLNPSLIIADEPLSALDTSSGARILKLLSQINKERGTSILLISHNLRVVRAATTYVLVMDNGNIVEDGPTKNVLSHPKTEVTKKLLLAETTLHMNPDRQQFMTE